MREKDLRINQNDINQVWSNEWKSQNKIDLNLFGQELFILGYDCFKKYVKDDIGMMLDAGAGTGRYGIKFAQDFPNCKVFVTDILDDALAVGKKLAEELEVKNVEFQREDLMRLSFPDNYFDLVFCDVVIQHLPNYKTAIFEMARVLKPGGRMIISAVNFWNPHTLYKFIAGKKYKYGYEKSFKKSELSGLLSDANLKIVGNDGFYFAYGILRLKKIHKIFKLFGRMANRFSKIVDSFANRFVSRHFGFEIFSVGEKK